MVIVDVDERPMNSAVADSDKPVASVHAIDVMANINANYERLNACEGGPTGTERDLGIAPGGSSISLAAHDHDHNGNGAGIYRSVNGAGYMYNGTFRQAIGPITTTPLWRSVHGPVSTAGYPANGNNYEMGVAYVSPGVETIKIRCCLKVSASGPQIRAYNFTDGTSGSTVSPTNTTAAWMDLSLPVAWSGGIADYERVPFDITVYISGGQSLTLYYFIPYEDTNATL